jgi:hypothetical protein
MGNDWSCKHLLGDKKEQIWLDWTRSVSMIVNLARQLCSGTHKVHEKGVGREIHGDELH